MNAKFGLRFLELESQWKEIASSETSRREAYTGAPVAHIETHLILGWCVKARHLISSVCGKNSEHYRSFVDAEEPRSYEDSPTLFKRVLSVFMAAKEDFEGGYLTSIRNVVQADVFSDELSQADELVRAGYQAPAAVIAGVVLETALREMCTQREIPVGKLSKMNEDLAKVGHYNSIVQKQITALAGIRNSAAHGKNDDFSAADVAAMIRDVERLLSTWLK